MSLINQVLNDLEKRGTDTVAKTDTVRAVPSATGQQRLTMGMAFGIILLVVLGGVLWKILHRVPAPPPPVKAPQTTRPIVSAPKPASQPQPAVVAQQPAEHLAPSLSLSFELSSIPLPSDKPDEQRQAPPEQHQAPAKLPKQLQASKQRHDNAAVKQSGTAPAKTDTEEGYGGPPIKHLSPQQQALDEFGQAVALIQQGRKSEALPHLETTLQLDPGHTAARQALVGLLLESRRNADAERILQDGLQYDPKQPHLAMLLARLQVERGALPQALKTLNTTMPFADQEADYHAFVAAVLQRLERHKEAITHYQIALHLSPNSAVWWMGLGISDQAVGDDEDARDAYQHALGLHQLNAELQAFVEKRLQALVVPAK